MASHMKSLHQWSNMLSSYWTPTDTIPARLTSQCTALAACTLLSAIRPCLFISMKTNSSADLPTVLIVVCTLHYDSPWRCTGWYQTPVTLSELLIYVLVYIIILRSIYSYCLCTYAVWQASCFKIVEVANYHFSYVWATKLTARRIHSRL